MILKENYLLLLLGETTSIKYKAKQYNIIFNLNEKIKNMKDDIDNSSTSKAKRLDVEHYETMNKHQ